MAQIRELDQKIKSDEEEVKRLMTSLELGKMRKTTLEEGFQADVKDQRTAQEEYNKIDIQVRREVEERIGEFKAWTRRLNQDDFEENPSNERNYQLCNEEMAAANEIADEMSNEAVDECSEEKVEEPSGEKVVNQSSEEVTS
ncbi:uncharacterized protein BDZ99DRAFT_461783 [Mytilinidion resinicola]|uniref:Uncharacterized protein n=1 Tax=Mytilinidion resinicola TaxID=574789 RepID=A0A6A6YTA4_9PEZI|nr:uncharacterized protein BDZ99DRAFT_461783 [Mytilinidion resinicola]KAF2811798.1 hypothetical protein BDZ99DRAFT_461783 [Mytilinidion resinicola]